MSYRTAKRNPNGVYCRLLRLIVGAQRVLVNGRTLTVRGVVHDQQRLIDHTNAILLRYERGAQLQEELERLDPRRTTTPCERHYLKAVERAVVKQFGRGPELEAFGFAAAPKKPVAPATPTTGAPQLARAQ